VVLGYGDRVDLGVRAEEIDVSRCHRELYQVMTVADMPSRIDGMARWEPDSRGRLRQAALELYGERGFENTTVAEIARRAGLTERTFFRHFADKREVLFAGSEELEDALVTAVAEAPDSVAPLDAVAAGLEAAGARLPQDAGTARRRQAIIAANAELRERELIKFASLSTALAAALRGRGLEEPAASLTAEVGIAVFRNAFERWIDPAGGRSFAALVQDSLAELRAVTAGAAALAH
jgi:AcrR family transcriptional regulator